MKTRFLFNYLPAAAFVLLVLAACHTASKPQPAGVKQTSSMHSSDTAILAPGAAPQLVARQFSFTEGPAADTAGNVFFTDQPNNRIWKWEPSGKLSIFMEPSGRSNGMFFDRKGNLLACADEHNEIWAISPDKKVTVLLRDVDGKKLNGPNDLWADDGGGVYFTDPFYPRPYWSHSGSEMPGQYLYYLPAGATAPLVVDTAMVQPNGIVGTPDGRYLYVADIGDNKTYRYEMQPGGVLRNRTLFTQLGSDGMTLDEKGNLYLTGNGVTVVDPSGKQIAHIAIPEKWTANVCFGGTQRNKLFITASQAVYIVDMKVKGAW